MKSSNLINDLTPENRDNSPPVRQKLRRTRPDMALKIKGEVHKQIDAGFLVIVEYPEWVANIVPVPKKDGKVQMCVDYRDLNKASLKDNFPLPHIDVLVDNIAQCKVFSFMDGFSGYNQIKSHPETGNIVHYPMGNLLLQSDDVRPDKRWCHLSEGDDYVVSRYDSQRSRSICGRHDRQVKQ